MLLRALCRTLHCETLRYCCMNTLTRAAATLLIMSALVLHGCSRAADTRYEASFLDVFDTVTTITGYSPTRGEFTALARHTHDLLARYHKLYDIYCDYDGINNIKTINDNAGVRPVRVDSEIISLLLFAKREYEATSGAVNAAMGSVLSIAREYREAGIIDPEHAELPPMDMLIKASQHCDIDDVVIDEGSSTVFLADPLMKLDVGAIGKGYAVERVAAALESEGVTSLLLCVGGNIRAIGGKPSGTGGTACWNIGIRDPDPESENQQLLCVEIKDGSVVSSGIYERYYTVDGVQYHHIIDPDTLMPSRYFTQVTIICRDSGVADALSTAVFNMPLEEGMELIENLKGTESLWVLRGGGLVYSSGFGGYITGT